MSQKNYNIEVLENDSGTFNLSFKIIIIGDSGVGKSCLSLMGTKNTFNQSYAPTIAFEFKSFNIKIDDIEIRLHIWDTCGQELYRSLISSFYRNSSLALLVFAINNKESFLHLDSWLNEIKINGSPDINLFLIGNKVDLENERVVSKEMVENFSKNNNIQFFFETSAKTGFNAQNVFIEASKLLYEQHLQHQERLSKQDPLLQLSNGKNNELEPIKEDEEDDNPGQNRKEKKCC
jgi:small GTP-binding protein